LDYYAILGVHPTAEDIVIRAAYKALAQRYHPDRFTGPQDEAHVKMSELTKAYEVLADPVRRKKYDRRRLTYTQSVATYFNGVPRDTRLAIDPRNRRSPAAMRRRSRVALSALMVAVVALSAFNLFQYSGQLRDWLTPGPPAPSAVEARVRTPPEVSGAIAVGVASSGAPQAPAASLPNPPTAHGGAPGPGAAAADAQAPGPQRPDATAASEAPMPKEAAEPPARQLAAEAAARLAAPTPAPPAEAPTIKERKRPATPPAVAANAPASRPAPLPASAEGAAPCSDTVAALGLCSPPTTARNK